MKTKANTPRPKHVPQRTCVNCRTVNAKRGMVRIVRTPTGTVEIDPTGKRSGRGAYLCRTRECWTAALHKKSLEYALKATISLPDKEALQAYMDTLPESDSSSDEEVAGAAAPTAERPAAPAPPQDGIAGSLRR